MLIGIHPDRSGEQSYYEKWTKFLEERGVVVRIVDLASQSWLEQVVDCDGVMWRWNHTPQDRLIAYRILHTIERYLQIPVYPNHATTWHYDEKVSQYYMLKAAGVPTPETWVFWDKDRALQWARKVPYPIVFKLSAGASSTCVTLVIDFKQAEDLISRMFGPGIYPYEVIKEKEKIKLRRLLSHWKRDLVSLSRLEMPGRSEPRRLWWRVEKNYVYFQEFLPGNAFDTRIMVIGNRAFGYRRFNRPDDFRASGSGSLCADNSEIDLRFVRMAHDISEKLGFQSMGYDFMNKNGLPVLSEVSYTSRDYPVHNCPGHWDLDLNWIEGHMWPEEAQVIDFIEFIKASKDALHVG